MEVKEIREVKKERKATELVDKMEKARGLLYIHGVLTDAENHKVRIRIRKWAP